MVFYQIWPRSFYDGNNDGMGDLFGVYQKLDYIKSLGVDGIWFSPLYPSPGADCGYDISNYMDIDQMYGGLPAFKKVLDGAHERGMKVLMDLVVNHTSDEHEWFQKSRQRIEPYTDYYIWRPAQKNGKLPNNWDSMFEGKSWAYDDVRGEYYLHLFAVKQADLNMDNPLVRKEVKNIMKFWLDLGVDGFREDVITYISKKEGLPNDPILPIYKGIFNYNHGPHVHEYLAEFKKDVLDNYDCMTIAEAPLVWPKRALDYIDEKTGQIDMMIQFQCMCADCLFTDYLPTKFSLRRLKKAFSQWQNKLKNRSWNMLYIENHDHPRVISRYGSEEFWKESGKMLATAYLFQQGTPFIYQGQEIGMLDWHPENEDMYKDVQSIYQAKHVWKDLPTEKRLHKLWRSSRDSARTLVQWDSTKNAGFSSAEPWFYANQNYTKINVEQQISDPDSILNFYKKAISLRKSLKVVKDGIYKEFNHLSSKKYVYGRFSDDQKLLVVCSFSKTETKFSIPKHFYKGKNGKQLNYSLILCNYSTDSKKLRPYEARVYLFE